MGNNDKSEPVPYVEEHITAREFGREQEDIRGWLSRVEGKIDSMAQQFNEHLGNLGVKIDEHIADDHQQFEHLKHIAEKLVNDYDDRQQELRQKENVKRENTREIKQDFIKTVLNTLMMAGAGALAALLGYTFGHGGGGPPTP